MIALFTKMQMLAHTEEVTPKSVTNTKANQYSSRITRHWTTSFLLLKPVLNLVWKNLYFNKLIGVNYIKKSSITNCIEKLFLIFVLWQIYIDFCPTAFAVVKKDELVKVALISETNIVPKKGRKLFIGLHQIIQPGWHTYWRYAGDSGLPTHLNWKTNNNLDIGQINWPLPQVIKVGSLVSYGYENETVLLVPLNVKNSETIDLTVEAEWLVCREICIPQRKVLSLKLPQKTDRISPTSFRICYRYMG